MKFTTLTYAALGVIGLAAVIVVPTVLYRSGSTAIPFWTETTSPGPLSSVHEFLATQCEGCHTPTRGVEAVSCLTCHATAAPELLTKTSTAFHANIGECAGCHVEHQGRERPPHPPGYPRDDHAGPGFACFEFRHHALRLPLPNRQAQSWQTGALRAALA